MAGIGENPVLLWQIGTAAIHQIEAGQPVLGCDFLGADVFLHGFVIERPTLHCRIVGDHNAGQPVDDPDTGHDSRTGHLAPVLTVGGKRRQLKKRSARIHQQVDPFADQQLAALAMPRDHVGAAASRCFGDPRAQRFDALALCGVVAGVGL